MPKKSCAAAAVVPVVSAVETTATTVVVSSTNIVQLSHHQVTSATKCTEHHDDLNKRGAGHRSSCLYIYIYIGLVSYYGGGRRKTATHQDFISDQKPSKFD